MATLNTWTEVLRCKHCGSIGVARLSQRNEFAPALVVDQMPAGFGAVSSEYGDTFFCKACGRAAT